MKYLVLLLLCATASAQSIKFSGLSALTTPASGDLIPIVDVSDTTQAASGTTKKITWANMFSGYAGGTGITTLGTVATGTWAADTIGVARGGTGQTSYTNGQLLIGNTTGNTLAKATLTGTANEITVTNGPGSITLSLPAAITMSGKAITGGTYQTAQFEAATIISSVLEGVEFADACILFSSATPTTTSAGNMAFDTNAWAASRGAVQVHDGTANTWLIAALASDTPTNGQVPKWNTGGTITWEDDNNSGAATNWTDIADASGDTTIALGAHETDFTSSIDAAGEATWTLTMSDADVANDTSAFDIKFNDGADSNAFYLRLIGDADGTPTNDYLFSQTAFTIGSGVAVTINGSLTVATMDVTTLNTGSMVFEGATADAFETTFAVTDPTADRTWTFGNVSATITATDGATLTFQGTDTYVGRATTDTLTNKTLTSPTLTTPSAFTTGGSITLAETHSIALDPAGSADGRFSGITVTGTAGAALAFGDLIVLDTTDSRWELADANSASGADGDVRGMVGICVQAAAGDGSATTILLQGIVRADTAFPALTVNSPVYVSETAGDVTNTSPTTEDNVVRALGYAMTADEMYFNPSATWITYDAP